jgi:alkylation response protein AidB-like acyl-CoA dehydrogenase
MVVTSESVLSDALLERCRARAPIFDRDNRFFQEDFDELRAAGYLNMALPKEFGGLGMNLSEVARETRRLARFAPATALGLNMHNYWVGDVADLWRGGDRSLEWLLKEAEAGEVFAAGHAESGNDIPGLLSTTTAERVDGGYRFTGRKSFGSLTPVWTRLGLHGMDTSDPAAPKVVHAFLPRGTQGATIKETWDVLGMRATASHDTVLEQVFIPDRYVARVLPAGAGGADMFILGFFTWGLTGFANVYYGLAQRVRELIVEQVKAKTSIALTRPMSYHPEIQHGIAEITMALESMEPHIESIAGIWSAGEAGPDWFLKLVAMKHHVVGDAFKVADLALDLSGGFGMFKKSELERLFRDARAGRFHPANSALTHEIVGKISLGISPDEQPRWG